MSPTVLLSIRPSRPEDHAFIDRLAGQAFRHYAREPAEVVHNMMREPDAITEVAERDGEPIGFFIVRLNQHHKDFGPLEQPKVAHLNAIAVDRVYRGRGVGRGLLARAMQLSHHQEALSMFLMTAAANERARLMFERAGFDYLGIVPNSYLARQDGLWMMRILRRP
jgi:ribosomal protein S18 acetylase RimI-like enzyme